MSSLITKAEALKLLKERTGRKFSKGIFSPHFQRGRIWAAGGSVFTHDIDKFLAERQARRDMPVDEKVSRRIMALVRACCAHDTTMENLLKLVAGRPEAVKQIEGARSWNSWTVASLMRARPLATKEPSADHADGADQIENRQSKIENAAEAAE